MDGVKDKKDDNNAVMNKFTTRVKQLGLMAEENDRDNEAKTGF